MAHRITLKVSPEEIQVLAQLLGVGGTRSEVFSPEERKALQAVTDKVLQAKAFLAEEPFLMQRMYPGPPEGN